VRRAGRAAPTWVRVRVRVRVRFRVRVRVRSQLWREGFESSAF
jgi:hypothetical protein